MTATTTTTPWKANDPEQVEEAKKLGVWPLDESNAGLLNEVHPRNYDMSCEQPHEVYDLIAIGAGAGGLVSSRQVSYCRERFAVAVDAILFFLETNRIESHMSLALLVSTNDSLLDAAQNPP
jgi:hypothetical protein